jgi:hypothetical protein
MFQPRDTNYCRSGNSILFEKPLAFIETPWPKPTIDAVRNHSNPLRLHSEKMLEVSLGVLGMHTESIRRF